MKVRLVLIIALAQLLINTSFFAQAILHLESILEQQQTVLHKL
jgi:hypothetical protein